MGGQPNPHGVVVKGKIFSVVENVVAFVLDEGENLDYFKENVGDAVVISVTDAPERD